MKKIQKHLNECLQRMQNGETLETCLQDYPGEEDELRSLLRITEQINEYSKSVNASSEFIQRTQEILNSAYRKKYLSGHTGRFIFLKPAAIPYKIAAVSTIVTIFTVVCGFTVSAKVSESVMPGHFLYPVKLASEELKLTFTFSEEQKINLLTDFAETRAEEIVYASTAGDEGKVEASLAKLEDCLDEIRQLLGLKIGEEEYPAQNDDSLDLLQIHGIVQSSSVKVKSILSKIDEPVSGDLTAAIPAATGDSVSVPESQPSQIDEYEESEPEIIKRETEPVEETDDQPVLPAPETGAPEILEEGIESSPAPEPGVNQPAETGEQGSSSNENEPPAPATTGNTPASKDDTGKSNDPPNESQNSSPKKKEIIERADKAYEKTIEEIEKGKEKDNNKDKDKDTNKGKDKDKDNNKDKKN